MKRTVAIILSLMMLFALTACGSRSEKTKESDTVGQTEENKSDGQKDG